MSPIDKSSHSLSRILRTSALVICAAVGGLVIVSLVSLALLPVALGLAMLVVWLLAALLIGWGTIEFLALLERWFESDSRFQR